MQPKKQFLSSKTNNGSRISDDANAARHGFALRVNFCSKMRQRARIFRGTCNTQEKCRYYPRRKKDASLELSYYRTTYLKGALKRCGQWVVVANCLQKICKLLLRSIYFFVTFVFLVMTRAEFEQENINEKLLLPAVSQISNKNYMFLTIQITGIEGCLSSSLL